MGLWGKETHLNVLEATGGRSEGGHGIKLEGGRREGQVESRELPISEGI